MPGLTPRAITELFNVIGGMDQFEVALQCYVVEIYRGALRDLLIEKKVKDRP